MAESPNARGVDLLADLLAQEADYEARLREIRAAIAAIRRLRGTPFSDEPSQGAAESTKPTEDENPKPPFYGQSQVDAAISVLEKCGEPLTVGEIVENLRQRGFPFASANPSTNLHWALRKRSLDKGDILNLPGSKWGLLAWRINDPKFARMYTALRAAKKRGVRGGARSFMTDERIAQFDAMREEGKTFQEISDTLGMSRSGLYKWAQQRKMENEENQ